MEKKINYVRDGLSKVTWLNKLEEAIVLNHSWFQVNDFCLIRLISLSTSLDYKNIEGHHIIRAIS